MVLIQAIDSSQIHLSTASMLAHAMFQKAAQTIQITNSSTYQDTMTTENTAHAARHTLLNQPVHLDWHHSQRNLRNNFRPKQLLILDYQMDANLNYSDWKNDPSDIPTGTTTTTYTINTTPRTTQLYTHTGPISHITIHHQTNNNHNLTIYHAHYAIAKHTTNEPTHSTWSPQTQQPT